MRKIGVGVVAVAAVLFVAVFIVITTQFPSGTGADAVQSFSVTVMRIAFAGAFCLVVGIVLIAMGGNPKWGTRVQGSIVSAEKTGVMLGRQPQVKVLVVFKDHEKKLRDAEYVQIVKPEDIAKLTEGTPVPVRYLRKDPSQVYVELDKVV